jgi:FkbM family methyltransferase
MNAGGKKIQGINDIQALNEKNIFLIYNGKSNKNLLIVSACRLSTFAYYFSQTTDYNIYMIYIIPFVRTKELLDETKIKDIVKKTDVIVCESITNFHPFRTIDQTEPTSFFSIFGVDFNKTKVYTIPNLEFHYLSHWVYHKCNVKCTPKALYDNYIKSRDILFKKCIDTKFYKTKKFIDIYFKKLQLFHSAVHPTVILSLVAFIETCEKMEIFVDVDSITKLIKNNFLGGFETPVFKIDIETFGLAYKATIQDDHLFEDKDLHPILDCSYLQTYENAKLIYNFFDTYATIEKSSYLTLCNLHHKYAHNPIKNNRTYLTTAINNPNWKVFNVENFRFVSHINDYNKTFESGMLLERMILNISKEYIDPNKNIIDIGANIGNHTVVYSNFTNGTVYSFEPQKEIYDILLENIKINKCDNVKAFNFGISDREDKFFMNARYDCPNNFGSFSIQKQPSSSGITVECRPIHNFNIKNVGFIKIDVEGHELNVLKGIELLLRRDKPNLIIEIWDHALDTYETFDFLKSINYRPLKKLGYSDYLFVNIV